MTDKSDQFACTLDTQGAEQRLPQVRALTDRLRRRERVDDRLVLVFEDGEGTADLVEEFVRDSAVVSASPTTSSSTSASRASSCWAIVWHLLCELLSGTR